MSAIYTLRPISLKRIISGVSPFYVYRSRRHNHRTFALDRRTNGIASPPVSNTTIRACAAMSMGQYPTAIQSDPSNQYWIPAALMTAASLLLISLTNTKSCSTIEDFNSVPYSHRMCQCLGRDTDPNDEDDPTDHNFDGDEHIELSDDDASKKHPVSNKNSIRQSIFGAGPTNRPTNVFDQDFQEVINTISDSISSSFNTGKVAQQMKELMDQVIVPKNTKSKNSESRNEDSFKQIVQCLFDILIDATNVTTTTKSKDEREEENTKGEFTIKANITQAVSDLLAAVQQLKVNKNIQELQHDRSSDESGAETLTKILPQSAIEDTTSIFDLCNLLMTYSDEIHQLVTKHMTNIDYQRITPTAIVYFADYANTKYEAMLQERLKHYSNGTGFFTHNQFLMQCRTWQEHQQEQLIEFFKRQQQIDSSPTATAISNATSKATIDPSILRIIDEHPDAVALTKLAYVDKIDQLRDGLQNLPSKGRYQYELVHCDLKSEPGKPAHFYTIRSGTNSATNPAGTSADKSSTTLDVVLVIRGTKTVADAITDLLCDTQPYRHWGKAHSYILDSGRYIATLYGATFDDLLHDRSKNISEINVTIYGHSLGAGAGAIAAMELYNLNDPRIQVQMIGYGCPAILSKNLAEQTSDYITTFINDSDLVPRLSGLSLTNLLYDILEFDWMPYAQNDVQNTFNDLQKFQPILFNSDTVTTMKNIISPILESIHHDTYIPSGTIPRLNVELYPPGKCIHIYRTGNGKDPSHRSACYVPNWFYSQIDVNKHMIDDHLLSSGYILAIADIQRPLE